MGSTIIYGDIMSGKSTLLQTYMYSILTNFKMEEVVLYAIDCNSGMLSGFECVENVKDVGILDKTRNEESILDEVIYNIEQRKNSYVGNELITSWKENNIKEPIIVLVIDDLAKLCDINLGKYERKITSILKEGASVGVYVLATSINVGGAGLPTRLASYFQSVVCMHLQEKYD